MAKHLANALKRNQVNFYLSSSFLFLYSLFTQTLQKLELFNNAIGPEGAQHLADALRNNTVSFICHFPHFHLHFSIQTLTVLNIGLNKIKGEGTQHLADALRTNTVNIFLSIFLLFFSTFSHTGTQRIYLSSQ
jgi:Ran GTPase-activating protein (RanGAP) involved in mRNA processing and transport